VGNLLNLRALTFALVFSMATTAVAISVNYATSAATRPILWALVGISTLATALATMWYTHSTSAHTEEARQLAAEKKLKLERGLAEKEKLEQVFRDPGWHHTLSTIYDNPASPKLYRFPLLASMGETFQSGYGRTLRPRSIWIRCSSSL
jgi:hypothetical protein